MAEVFCKNCGRQLKDSPETRPDERTPCPECGSTDRDLHVFVSDTIEVSSHFAALGERDGKAIGFRESEREGRIAAADLDEDGSLSFSVLGTSPQGEEDTLETCRVLVQALNASGSSWGRPSTGTGAADCVCSDQKNSTVELHIQVVRAIVDDQLWMTLNRHSTYERSGVTKGQLAGEIQKAIGKKASLPPTTRATLLLALDATRLPVMGFDVVIAEFGAQYGEWARSLGFQEIWLVGPQPALTWRLDVIP